MKRDSSAPKPARGLKRIAAPEDADIVANADAPAWTPEVLARAAVERGRGTTAAKTLLALRVDSDAVEWFRAR